MRDFFEFIEKTELNKSYLDWIDASTKIRAIARLFGSNAITKEEFVFNLKECSDPLRPQAFYILTKKDLRSCLKAVYDCEIDINILTDHLESSALNIQSLRGLNALYFIFATSTHLGSGVLPVFEAKPEKMIKQAERNPFLVFETVSEAVSKQLCEILFPS